MMVNNPAMICCGSLLPVFGVKRFGDVSPYSCSNYFSSVSVAEWPPVGVHTVDHMFSLCFDYL